MNAFHVIHNLNTESLPTVHRSDRKKSVRCQVSPGIMTAIQNYWCIHDVHIHVHVYFTHIARQEKVDEIFYH